MVCVILVNVLFRIVYVRTYVQDHIHTGSIILYTYVYVKSMKIIIDYILFLLKKYSTCIYFMGFYAFQSVFFATIYNNM